MQYTTLLPWQKESTQKIKLTYTHNKKTINEGVKDVQFRPVYLAGS
jgi:hypothetical protein